MQLTDRQRRELEFHQGFAKMYCQKADEPVALSIVRSTERRWWNAYWETYRVLRGLNLAGKRVLVPGSGFGDDIVRLAALGAEPYGIDLSPELVEIARERAERAGFKVTVDAMPAERLSYPSQFFDGVLFIDILHHVHIEDTMKEVRRVLKPEAFVVGDELYTHSALQRVRESRLVAQNLYPRMVKFIYGTERPYITEDEHKINEKEFSLITACLEPDVLVRYFSFLEGRVIPSRWTVVSQLDRIVLASLGPGGRFAAGRLVFAGTIN